MHDLVIRGATIADGTGEPTFVGDVAVDGDIITDVGTVDGRGRRELDGDGLVLAPGWVDIHTHYDGQVSWDPELTPSSWHGVTTVVMGNCGVGFAPVRPGEEDFLIELMESVEDIPGTALHEGIDWGWETFERVPRLARREAHASSTSPPRSPTAPLRAYVMGERAHDDATHDEIARDGRRGRARRCAPAPSGFTHLSHHAAPIEARLRARHRSSRRRAARHRRRARRRRARRVPDGVRHGEHRARATVDGRAGAPHGRDRHLRAARKVARVLPNTATRSTHADRLAAEGVRVVPQVSCRPTGMLFGLQSSLHPVHHPPDVPLDRGPAAGGAGGASCDSPRCGPRCWPSSPTPTT